MSRGVGSRSICPAQFSDARKVKNKRSWPAFAAIVRALRRRGSKAAVVSCRKRWWCCDGQRRSRLRHAFGAEHRRGAPRHLLSLCFELLLINGWPSRFAGHYRTRDRWVPGRRGHELYFGSLPAGLGALSIRSVAGGCKAVEIVIFAPAVRVVHLLRAVAPNLVDPHHIDELLVKRRILKRPHRPNVSVHVHSLSLFLKQEVDALCEVALWLPGRTRWQHAAAAQPRAFGGFCLFVGCVRAARATLVRTVGCCGCRWGGCGPHLGSE
mmetsp:Transcript_8621/g.22263  ORF Transcript_8621/g.22263 Transcript_8621/m.22263 type:complete len:267 (-) Transcript_8621:284-1084(-)